MFRRPVRVSIDTRGRSGGRVATFGCLLVTLSASVGHAQFRVDSYTTENGLTHNDVWSMCQTHDGYLWLGTGDGLVRFDGAHFRIFNSTNTPALQANGFSPYALMEDHQGALWAGTFAGGAIRYYGGVFTTYTTRDGLPSDTVVRIDEGADGTIWIFTNSGLAKWRNNHLIRVPPEPNSPFAAQAARGHVVEPWDFFGLWKQDSDGWSRFAYGKWSRLPLPPGVPNDASILRDSVSEDSKGRLWFQIAGHPDEYYCASDGNVTVFKGLPRGARVYYRDTHGFLLLVYGRYHLGLWKNGQFLPLKGLSTRRTVRVLEDREGGFWVGTSEQGLLHLRPQLITVHQPLAKPGSSHIHSLLRDHFGNVWSATREGLWSFRNGRFEKAYRVAMSEPSSEILALFEDRPGVIWIGSRAGVWLLENGRLRKATGLPAQIRGPVYVIHRDRAGDLWFGSDDGLYRLRTGQLLHYGKADGLGGDNVKTILEDRSGRLFFGTEEGLALLVNGGFRSWTKANGWTSAEVASMYEDSAGVLWIGTWDKGLNRVDKDKLVLITTAQGLYSNSIFNIAEDERGFLWMSCRLGLFRVRKQELNDLAAGRISFVTSTHFGTAYGLINPDCTSGGQPAGFKAPDGKLWFRTRGGIGVIDPKMVPFNPKPPPVSIEDCFLDRRSVSCRTGLILRPSNQALEIQYTALSFIRADDIRFKYKLEGLDGEWVDAATRRTAYYSHLPAGKYEFRVIAANSDGVWNTTGVTLPITMLPPFYRTWWFLGVVFTVLLAVATTAWQYRVSHLKRAHAAQQEFSRQLINSQERERKRIAAELHDSLGQQLLIIKNWAVLALSKLDGQKILKEPLDEISSTASHAVDEMREIAYNLRPYQLEKLGLTAAIRGLITRVAAASNIQFSTKIHDVDGLFSQEIEISIYRIVQEALNNTIKHSQATEGRVLVTSNSGRLELLIEDNGRGFTPQDGSITQQNPEGFGLLGITERVRMLDGRVVIQSAPGHGSTIQISLKMQRTA